nr:putative exonuclease GOR [Bactrocera oleae]
MATFNQAQPILYTFHQIYSHQLIHNFIMPHQMHQSGETPRRHSDQYRHLQTFHQNANRNQYNPIGNILQMFGQQQQTTLPKQNRCISLQMSQIVKEQRKLQHKIAQHQSQKTGDKRHEKKPKKQPTKIYYGKKPQVVRNTAHHAAANTQVVASTISQSELVASLRTYIIAPHLLHIYGYPAESIVHSGKIVIYKKFPAPFYARTNTDNNVNPTELVRQLVPNNDAMPKQCVRCERPFRVRSSGVYVTRKKCIFHWGKLHKVHTRHNKYNIQYTCCGRSRQSAGCATNPLHVWTGVVSGINGPYGDFVHTRKLTDEPKGYALDCEMSYSGCGLALTKITVIGFDGQLVYEHFVRPIAEIVDYNTRFSGITERDLSKSNKRVKTLGEVQRDLLQIIHANTILIGHGLENDLRVLQIVHKTVIDTSIVFPHSKGFPYRHSLKHLTKTYLKRNIQLDGQSHDSLEDARACLELMLWKVATDKQKGRKV